MSMIFGGPSAPPPPPPPPAAPQLASRSIAEAGAMQKETLAAAEGAGLNNTNVTGGQGVKEVSTQTTKSLLGD